MHVKYFSGAVCRTIATLLVLLSTQTLVKAEGVVTATFRMDSTFFKSVFPPQTVLEVENAVAQALANAGQSQFPFLQWQSASSSPAAGPQLVLRMRDLPNGACDPQPTINLQWFGVIASDERALRNVDQFQLYQTCDPDLPTQEPERLLQDIVNAVSEMLRNTATQKIIMDQLLARVPFADELINHENKWFLLPVSAQQLLAGEGTKMLATFDFALNEDDRFETEMRIEPRYDGDGRVKVLILTFVGAPLELNLQQGGAFWDDALENLPTQSSDMKVFMREYILDPFAGQTVGDTDVLSDL